LGSSLALLSTHIHTQANAMECRITTKNRVYLLSPRLSLPFAKERDSDNQRDATDEQLLHLITSAVNFLLFFKDRNDFYDLLTVMHYQH